MPVEGHWDRLGTPLSRREKRLLIAVGCLLIAIVAAIAIYSLADRSSSKPQAGCVTATFGASLGGATVQKCGAAAREFCRSQSLHSAQVADACRQQGIPTD
jgi:hypothetical protein